MIKLGILGCGNMGGAILHGLAEGRVLAGKLSLLAYDLDQARCSGKHITTVSGCAELAAKSDFLLLAVKPQQLPALFEEIAAHLNSGKVLVSIAAGLELEVLRALSKGVCPVVRVMPNTPAIVGQGIFGLCFDDRTLTKDQKALLEDIFSALGRTIVLPESKFNAFSVVSSCGPAYVFHMLDAMIEGAVTLGFGRSEATSIVYGMCAGSVVLAEETGVHLAVLREQVSSPAGMTIAGLNHLDRCAVRGHMVDAMLASYEKGLALGRPK